MISIIIPVWKTLYLDKTIASLVSQSYRDIEIVIVESRRLEGFDNIVDRYKDDRVVVKRHDVIPMIDNWNKCMSYATGEFCILMCDDDMFHKNHLLNLVKLSNKYPKVDLFHSRIKLIDSSGTVIRVSPQCAEYETVGDFMYQRVEHNREHYISDFMFRTKKFREIGGFVSHPMAWYSDVDTAVRMAIPNGVAFSSEPTFFYRSSPENVSSNLKPIEALVAVEEHFEVLAEVIELLDPSDSIYRECLSKRMSKLREKAFASAYTRTGVGAYPFAPFVRSLKYKKRFPVPMARAIFSSLLALGMKIVP